MKNLEGDTQSHWTK